MSTQKSTLAQLAQALAEKKLQQEQKNTYVLARQLEQLEDRAAVYRYHALQAHPNPPPQEWVPSVPPPPVQRPSLRRPHRVLQHKYEVWRNAKDSKNTVLVIDNGGLGRVIEQLSYVYQVVVWRLENSRQPMPEVAAQFEYVPQVEFDYDACLAQFEALQQSSSVVLMLVDGLVWQTPLLVAAEQGIPAVLCFEQSVHAGVLAGQWMQSRWRRQQSFMWSFEVLCVDSSTVDFFVSERCLASAQYSLVVAPEARTSTWWYEQVQSWRKRYRHFLAQSRYLQKHSFDLDYFIGSEQWRRNNSLEQQLVHFLFAWRLQLYMRQLIPGFDMSCYAQHHPQLQDRNPLVDFLKRRRPEGPWSKRLIQPGQAPTVVPSSSGVALHIHAYYIDSLPGLLQALTCNKIRPDLFISVRNEADLAQAQQQCALYPVSVCIRVVPNRGRDIGPFLTEFGPELVANYRIIGHVHTKQSLFHTERDFITAWQDFLLVHALGNTKYPMADEIVGTMQQNPTIGMVFADDPNVVDWGENKDYAQLLVQQLGWDAAMLPSGSFKFPVGTMFWLRAEVLKPLVQLNLTWDDYPDEPLAQDGSILHALERFFGLLPEQVGLETALTYIPGVSR